MKIKVAWSLLAFAVLIGASLRFTQSASSNSSYQLTALPRAAANTFNLMPVATIFNVDRTDDVAGASNCTGVANDCSLRGAIIAANSDLTSNPVTINLQSAT